jgi:hypothetical protein
MTYISNHTHLTPLRSSYDISSKYSRLAVVKNSYLHNTHCQKPLLIGFEITIKWL